MHFGLGIVVTVNLSNAITVPSVTCEWVAILPRLKWTCASHCIVPILFDVYSGLLTYWRSGPMAWIKDKQLGSWKYVSFW